MFFNIIRLFKDQSNGVRQFFLLNFDLSEF